MRYFISRVLHLSASSPALRACPAPPDILHFQCSTEMQLSAYHQSRDWCQLIRTVGLGYLLGILPVHCRGRGAVAGAIGLKPALVARRRRGKGHLAHKAVHVRGCPAPLPGRAVVVHTAPAAHLPAAILVRQAEDLGAVKPLEAIVQESPDGVTVEVGLQQRRWLK